MDTLGACELVLGLTVAWPKVLVLVELWVEDEALLLLLLVDGDAAVAGWLARARPTVTPKTAAEANTSPRLASAARRRAILIGVAGMILWDHRGVRDR
ncbi:MAG: hypothetical protein QOJ25_2103 [Solirubrobacteraceae bacterium]|nr:hypothetical protein [Solirubrobacteraceae bacterium]